MGYWAKLGEIVRSSGLWSSPRRIERIWTAKVGMAGALATRGDGGWTFEQGVCLQGAISSILRNILLHVLHWVTWTAPSFETVARCNTRCSLPNSSPRRPGG